MWFALLKIQAMYLEEYPSFSFGYFLFCIFYSLSKYLDITFCMLGTFLVVKGLRFIMIISALFVRFGLKEEIL